MIDGSEHILLESDEERVVPQPHGPRRRHARVDVPDRIRRRVLRLEIIDYVYLIVRVQRSQSVMAEYVLDLRFVDPSVRMSRHIATRWLIATLVLAALAVAIGWRVPDVLLSGHHAEIAKWRREQALAKTKRVRPDLLE